MRGPFNKRGGLTASRPDSPRRTSAPRRKGFKPERAPRPRTSEQNAVAAAKARKNPVAPRARRARGKGRRSSHGFLRRQRDPAGWIASEQRRRRRSREVVSGTTTPSSPA